MRRILGIVLIMSLGILAFVLLRGRQKTGNEISAQALTTAPSVEGFARVDGARPLSFPDDLGPHPDYLTEWWYYTGNLDTGDGRHFGYELTFFRIGLVPLDQIESRPSNWATNQIFMAHFALTDVQGDRFYAFQRLARGAVGLAGAESQPYRVWLDDWEVQQMGTNAYQMAAASDGLSIDFELRDEKGPVLQGEQGYSRKGADPTSASYYFSQPQLLTEGEIRVGDKVFQISGSSWMDHEFSTNALERGQIGWDWFSIQLDDDTQIMLYQIRRDDGSIDPFSSGTLIAPDGSTKPLGVGDFSIETQGTWRSPHSDAVYPMGWRVRIPSAGLDLELKPYLQDQELNLSTVYWEGAVKTDGTQNGKSITAVGYVEMTGYAEPLGPGL